MSYSRFYTTWHDYPNTTTPVVAAFLQALEDYLVTVTNGIAPPSSPSTNDALVYNGTGWVNAKLVNANIDSAAAIAYSKLALAASIVNGDVSATAAIARSKLDFGSGLVNADIAAAAAIVYSKLNLAGSILNADISASAAIALSKLAGYPSDSTKFARGDGTWAVPVSSGALTKITDTILAASAASFDFTSIPGTYNHLVIRGVLRTDEVASLSSPTVRFNNDSGATYDYEEANGQGVTAGAGHVENGTSGRAGACTGASATSGWFGPIEIGIDAYTSTVAQKTYRSVSGGLIGSASSIVRTITGIYHPSSIVAITRVTILPGGGTNFVAGSHLTLYGVL